MAFITVQPAYGRDYGLGREDNENDEEVHKSILRDWQDGMDFVIASIGADMGRMINKADFLGMPNPEDTIINVRFNGDRDIMPIRCHKFGDESITWQIGGYVEADRKKEIPVADPNAPAKGKHFTIIKEIVLKDKSVFAKVGDKVLVFWENDRISNPSMTNGERTVKLRIETMCNAVGIKLPSLKQLEKWMYDSVCKSVFGKKIEPDGHDEHGSPSWLIAMGVM